MKRDIDLARQLLFDIEARGTECSFGVLHATTNGEAIHASRNGHDATIDTEINGHPSDVVRYHLRLLIDAGLIKEIDRTTAGALCVRLTNAGHELIELSRSDLRWRDAKACCYDTTGGLSLTVLRTILLKWAVEPVTTGMRYPRRRAASYRPLYYHRVEPRRRYESTRRLDARYYDYGYGYDYPSTYASASYTTPSYVAAHDDDYRYVRTRPDYRDAWVPPAYERDEMHHGAATYETEISEPTVGVSLPVSLI